MYQLNFYIKIVTLFMFGIDTNPGVVNSNYSASADSELKNMSRSKPENSSNSTKDTLQIERRNSDKFRSDCLQIKNSDIFLTKTHRIKESFVVTGNKIELYKSDKKTRIGLEAIKFGSISMRLSYPPQYSGVPQYRITTDKKFKLKDLLIRRISSIDGKISWHSITSVNCTVYIFNSEIVK